ncbi:MAG: hypothetical protein QOC87_723 [Actinomycetota bacterium]|nr:hypothetical protein [Actinomycetota bacterium]
MSTIPVVIGTALIGAGFFGFYRPWQMKWGTTTEEVARSMPGDELVSFPTFNATRAVTIEALPEDIWPWIVQIGFGRAGWYSYDFLDNFGHHSAKNLLPEFQHIAIGDPIPMGPGGSTGVWVKDFELGRSILWWNQKSKQSTWVWTLDPMRDGTTRLVTRVRSHSTWRHPSTVMWLPILEVADFPMMRKCLLGIKRRSERLAHRLPEKRESAKWLQRQ